MLISQIRDILMENRVLKSLCMICRESYEIGKGSDGEAASSSKTQVFYFHTSICYLLIFLYQYFKDF